jgi:hypothetical protein
MKYPQILLIISAIYSSSTLVQAEYDSRYPTGQEGVRRMIIPLSVESGLHASSVSLSSLLCVASSFVCSQKGKGGRMSDRIGMMSRKRKEYYDDDDENDDYKGKDYDYGVRRNLFFSPLPTKS